jgi:urocanate hydratase
MGDIFSLGFGPFRWVCTSGDPADLELTDKTATEVIENLANKADEMNRMQYQGRIFLSRVYVYCLHDDVT